MTVPRTIACYSLVAMITDLCHHLTYDSWGAWHTVYALLLSNYECDVISLIIRWEHSIQCMSSSSRIISEMLPEIHTMEKFDFLKSAIYDLK